MHRRALANETALLLNGEEVGRVRCQRRMEPALADASLIVSQSQHVVAGLVVPFRLAGDNHRSDAAGVVVLVFVELGRLPPKDALLGDSQRAGQG